MDAEKLYNLYTQLDEKERVKFGIKTRRFEAEEGLRKSNTKEKLFNELTNIKDDQGNPFFSQEFLKDRLK
jgi:hypothetical protein